MNHSLRERVIALAAMFQASALVHQVASSGSVAQPEQDALFRSLFVTDAGDAEEVYGSHLEVEIGLRNLITQLGDDASLRNVDKTRYIVGILHLERLLKRRPEVLKAIGEELESMQSQLQHFEIGHRTIMARLADIYVQHISNLGPRIMVSGKNNYLDNPDNANRVRALLLAGIRGAVLWRQCGGSRWQLMFKRRAILEEANRLLA
ncbi:MAG: high frequency lysogenization protein HflD [Chromatiales bacterium]|nr:high frequency lysogenization protein HflD [Chromatiales bacterium]